MNTFKHITFAIIDGFSLRVLEGYWLKFFVCFQFKQPLIHKHGRLGCF